MKKLVIALCAVLVLGVGVPTASAGTIGLLQWALNQDGAVSDSLNGDAPPLNWNFDPFDTSTGLGTITATITGAGAHNILVFLDIEIDEAINTFFNEYGSVIGAPGTGQSWEIDEPGFGGMFGNIFGNFTAGALDNTNAFASGAIDDVSFALGWAFTLAAGETATLNFRTSLTAPAGAFYLVQTDPASSSSVYFTSDNTIRGGSEVPEPATLLLFGTGLAGVIGLRRRKK
jgi:hypothetical protein